jgi:hypothetical protein
VTVKKKLCYHLDVACRAPLVVCSYGPSACLLLQTPRSVLQLTVADANTALCALVELLASYYCNSHHGRKLWT